MVFLHILGNWKNRSTCEERKKGSKALEERSRHQPMRIERNRPVEPEDNGPYILMLSIDKG